MEIECVSVWDGVDNDHSKTLIEIWMVAKSRLENRKDFYSLNDIFVLKITLLNAKTQLSLIMTDYKFNVKVQFGEFVVKEM